MENKHDLLDSNSDAVCPPPYSPNLWTDVVKILYKQIFEYTHVRKMFGYINFGKITRTNI